MYIPSACGNSHNCFIPDDKHPDGGVEADPLTLYCYCQVVQGAMYLLEDDTKLGTVLMLHVSGRAYEWTQHSASLRRVILESKTGGSCSATSYGSLRWKHHGPECRN